MSKKVTAETERKTIVDVHRKEYCDLVIRRAVAIMLKDGDAPAEIVIDRLLSFAAAWACNLRGSQLTAGVFRHLADEIAAGVFHNVTGEGGRQH